MSNPYEKYKNKHAGQRCFVMGTGPSLLKQDLSKLKGELIVSCNQIYKKPFEIIPPYLCVSDPGVSRKYRNEFEQLNGKTVFVLTQISNNWNYPEDKFIVHVNATVQVDQSSTIDLDFKNVHWGQTVIIDLCLPFAAFLGCREIYLLGCDCEDTGHFYKIGDPRLSPEAWSPIFSNYAKMGKFFEQVGGKIRNATHGGKLEVFERVSFDSLFE